MRLRMSILCRQAQHNGVAQRARRLVAGITAADHGYSSATGTFVNGESSRARSFATSSVAPASSSSHRRTSKIMTLPINLPESLAKTRGRTILVQIALSARQTKRWLVHVHAFLVLLRETMKLDFTRWWERPIQLERFSTVYLPYWCIDAMFSGQITGEDGRKATLKGASYMSVFPAHSWKEMRSLPVPVPRGGMMPASSGEEDDLDANEELWEPFEPSTAQGATVLPFVISPHSLIAKANASDFPEEGAKFTFAGIYEKSKPIRDWLGRKLMPERADVKQKMAEILSKTIDYDIKPDPTSVSLDFLAAQPVMLPFHIAKYRNIHHDIKEELTLVLPAWDASCRNHIVGGIRLLESQLETQKRPNPKLDGKWFTRGRRAQLAHITGTALPRVPCAPAMMEYARKYHELMDEAAEKAYARGADIQPSHRPLFGPPKSFELATQQHEGLDDTLRDLTMARFNAQASEWLSSKPLEPMIKEEQIGHEARIEHNYSARTVEADHGLGETIDWDNKHYMRLFDEDHKKVRGHMSIAGLVDEADCSLKSVQLFTGKRLEILAKEHPEVEEGMQARKTLEEPLDSWPARRYKWSFAAARSAWMKPR